MQLATVLTPESDENLSLAQQCGVTEMVTRYRGSSREQLSRDQQRFDQFSLRLSVIEGYLPIEKIKVGRDDDGSDLDAMKTLIRNMGELEIPILCYNFMAGTDWVRTRLDVGERGGAKVTAFDVNDVERAKLLGHDGAGTMVPDLESVSTDQLWGQLERFLTELVPVAEQAGVVLAMHPDDPPLPSFQNKARIMNSVEAFERLMELVPSPSNGICFCQGTFTTMGVDVLSAIRRLGPHIRYVHFRDVRGTPQSFTETFHDNGPTDMVAAMRAYREIGFHGPIRADHVPQLVGEDEGEPGYTTKGRLFAWGFMRGLMQAS